MEYFNISEFYRGGTLWLDSQSNLWIGTEPHGLFRYNIKTKAIDEFSIRTKALSSDKIFSITEDSDHSIWIGTDGGGLYEYRYDGNKLLSYKHDDENPHSLSSNAVFAVYESDPGVLWVSIYASGLNVYKKNKNKFISYSTNFKPGTGISQKSVLSLAQAEGNKVWVGTDGGGLNLFDPEKQSFQYFTTSNSSINSNIIKSLLKDKAGNLWLGSYAGGMGKVNFKQGTSTHFVANPHTTGKELLNANVWSLCESSDGKIWIGFIGFGLQVYDQALQHFTYYPFDPIASSKGTCNIHVIFEDSRKRIWIGSQGAGIGYYDPLLKNFVRVSLNTSDHKNIDINEIGSIFEDTQHTIWLGTSRSGLVKIVDLSKGIAESYTMKDGFSSSKVVSIQEDDHHNLWLGTSNGICRFNPSSKQVINFDKEDGLVNKEYNYNSSLKSTDGKLYFGGMYGLDVFHPDSMVFNTTMPKVEITELKIFNHVIHPNQVHNGRTYLNEDINLTEKLVLTHNDYVFSLDFAALDYISPNKNKYAYRLMGFHNEWTYVGSHKRSVTYTNLDPGEYTFNVIASNNDGKWNKTGAMLKIRVLPPWWETWWFRILVLMLFLASFIVFYYLRLRSVKKRNRILKTEVKKQTAQLIEINKELLEQKVELEKKTVELESANKTKDKFFSIVAHDLKGPINALSFLTNTLNKEYVTMPATTHQEFIWHIDHSAIQLKKLVINLLEWARTQTKQTSVKPERISVNELLQSNIKLLQEQASQKAIEMSIETRDDNIVLADYNMVNTVFRNMISNSIKYSRNGGKIKLHHKNILNKYIEIAVEDSGIGIPPEMLKNLFATDKCLSRKGTAQETGTGLGLVICHEFVQLNQGSIRAESIENEGTTFFITLPVAT